MTTTKLASVYTVQAYGDGIYEWPTAERHYPLHRLRAALRWRDAQIRRGIVTIIYRDGSTPPVTHWRG